MPRELRRIIFSDEELLEAMAAHNRTLANKVILGDVQSCTVAEGPSVAIESRVRDGNVYRSEKAEAPVEFILHSLIRFCLENNIMIPRAGRKTAEYCDGEVCLQISIGQRS